MARGGSPPRSPLHEAEAEMSKAGRQAWACWAVAAFGLLGLLRLALGPAGGAEGAGEAIGRLLALTGVAALATWWLARRRAPAWGWARFAGTYVLALLLLALASAFGRARAEAPLGWPELAVPEGWTSERLEGASSAPQDQERGRRLRQQWHGATGTVVLEATCAWLARTEVSAPGAELAKAQRHIGAAYAAQDVQVTPSPIRSAQFGGRDWRIADLQMRQQDAVVLRMRVAMARTSRCALSVMFAGAPEPFASQEARFDVALAELRSD
jgi:hypothetical protein